MKEKDGSRSSREIGIIVDATLPLTNGVLKWHAKDSESFGRWNWNVDNGKGMTWVLTVDEIRHCSSKRNKPYMIEEKVEELLIKNIRGNSVDSFFGSLFLLLFANVQWCDLLMSTNWSWGWFTHYPSVVLAPVWVTSFLIIIFLWCFDG